MTTANQDLLERARTLSSNFKTSELTEQRGYASILLSKYQAYGYKTDAVSTTTALQSHIAKNGITTLKNSMRGVNFIAKKAEEQGKKEGESILSRYTQAFAENQYGDKLIRNVDLANPYKSIVMGNKFEASKSVAQKQAELKAISEVELSSLNQRVLADTPAAGPRSILEKGNYLDNFKSDKAVSQLLKGCIPCEFRVSFTAEFGLPWLNIAADMKKKWKELLDMLRSLFSGKLDEFGKDFCNLFKFLDGQCIPDITGLLSLLSLMQLKYFDLGLASLDNILNQLLSPFLAPVIGSLTSNLDKYADLIIGPLKCIVRALEFQITNLQKQINGAINIADMNRDKFNRDKINFLESKAKALRLRKVELDRKRSFEIDRKKGTGIVSRDPLNSNAKPLVNADRSKRLFPSDREERVIKTKLVRDGISLTPNLDFLNYRNNKDFKEGQVLDKTQNRAFQEKVGARTFDKEIAVIDRELAAIDKDRKGLLGKMTPKGPSDLNKSNTLQNSLANQTLTSNATAAIDNLERAQKSIITDLTEAINDGIGIVKQSIDIYREEFMRIMLGRMSNQSDQIEFTRMIQKFMRLISMVNAVQKLSKGGLLNFKKFCKKGPGKALSEAVKGIKAAENQSGMPFDFLEATDADGQPLIVIVPSGAKVNVSGVDYGDMNLSEDMFGDSSVNLNSIVKTVSFNDLNEVHKMNKDGIIPDLGDISSKNIEIDAGVRAGSDLDLHFKTSYAIISNEFCSKSAIDFGSSDTVKKWAANLWQKE